MAATETSGPSPRRPREPDSAWEAAFEQAMLAFLLDIVRREMSPGTYQAFEVFALGECSGVEAARITGLTRNAVYQAHKKVLRRLRELGAEYGDRGPPDEAIRAALRLRAEAPAERSFLTRIEQTPSHDRQQSFGVRGRNLTDVALR